MIRTHLVKALYRNILGPENGSNELVRDPYKKYEVGILNSSHIETSKQILHDRSLDREIYSDTAEISAEAYVSNSTETISENMHALENIRQEIDTDINFKMGACSLGLYFVLKGESPQFQICATWGRYDNVKLPEGTSHLFERHPNFYITEWQKAHGDRKTFELIHGVNGSVVTHPGVFCHIFRTRVPNSNKWLIRIYLENKSKFGTKDQTDRDRVFQPQIRVVLKDCELADLNQGVQNSSKKTDEETKEDLLYHKSRTKAKGHLCSAVWKGVDPEFDRDGGIGSISWPDLKKVSNDIQDRFINPDVRTEYIPLYTILQPEMKQTDEFNAQELSQLWNALDIGKKLDSIPDDYFKWIISQRQELEEKLQSGELDKELYKQGNENLKLCEATKNRIKSGIDFLKENEKARAAFCFMNVVMNDKRNNEEKTNLSWRKFQIAFILQSLRGVSGDSKVDREKADVLWFPTGGGKTEAYLGIVIFAIAYRRLLPDDELRNDGGTTVLSRYTLRLLTLQQFHRSVGAILAADLRRVENWLPDNAKGQGKILDSHMKSRLVEGSLWGKHRISIGLWIGSDITPKDFAIQPIGKDQVVLNAEGELLPTTARIQTDKKVKGDPAQIQNCPICDNTLCIPKTGGSNTVKLTWIIWSSLSQNELESMADKILENSNIKINLRPTFDPILHSHKGQYYRMTMTISSKHEQKPLERGQIDSWWDHFVMEELDPGKTNIRLESTSPSMPGYFFLNNQEINQHYDFAVFCTNKDCRLNATTWSEEIEGMQGVRVPEPFKKDGSPYTSLYAPISALTIDEQVYSSCPSFLIATVDKFANLPFVPKCSSIFGNVDVVHTTYGYGRKDVFEPSQLKQRGKKRAYRQVLDELHSVKGFNPPSLILQDELHLIEGPLGSMVGAYEMAVDVLSDNGSRPKYIASSATIRETKSQVGTIFRRNATIFPPSGINSSDNYFSKVSEDITCVKKESGRLYLGIATTKSIAQLPIKSQAIIMSEIFKIRNNPKLYDLPNNTETENQISMYWTFVSYFTDLQLLSKFANFYKEYVTQHVSSWSPTILPNYPMNLDTTSLITGLHMFPISIEKDMEISGVIIYTANAIGSAYVALYENNKLIHEFDSQKWLRGINTFSFPDEKTKKIKHGSIIWLAIRDNNEKMIFESMPENLKNGIMDKNFTTDSFPDTFDEKNTIKERPIRFALISPTRLLKEANNIQLSSDTKSENLTLHLNQLGEKFVIDSLQTSPVFGTGIDMDRLGIMQIMNQPKTNSGYIQSSGRVGRTMPGLVINWLKAGRARDLSHYEDFVGYHRMLHRFVEPLTASPFSEEAMQLCLGPILVAILRNLGSINGEIIDSEWITKPLTILTCAETSSVSNITNSLKKIASSDFIAKHRKITPENFERIFGKKKDHWSDVAKELQDKNMELIYDERNPLSIPKHNVVLGTLNHRIMNLNVVYQNTPNSLRQTESTASFSGNLNNVSPKTFGDVLDNVQIRPSQFITRYGPGSLIHGKSLTWVVPELRQIITILQNLEEFRDKNSEGLSQLKKYEIIDFSMKRILHKFHPNSSFTQIKLFTLPTNASLSRPDFKELYKCNELSKWVVCYSNSHPSIRVLTEIAQGDKRNSIKCPECKRQSKIGDSSSTDFFGVRYMLACKVGHLGDIDWKNEVHKFNRNCKGNVFEWRRHETDDGFDLSCMGHWDDRDSFIQSDCNAKTTYFELKHRSNDGEMQCSETFAEAADTSNCGCTSIDETSLAKMVSKSQSSIRMPIVKTTMEIDKYSGEFFRLWSPVKDYVRLYVDLTTGYDKYSFIKYFENKTISGINDKMIKIAKETPDTRFNDEIEKILKINTDDISEYEALKNEFDSLINQTRENGQKSHIQPNASSTDVKFRVDFEVGGINFQAMPFSNIKVTQVQAGYTREITPPRSNDNAMDMEEIDMSRVGDLKLDTEYYTDEDNNKWYLANRLQGEGIFIHFNPDFHTNWKNALKNTDPTTINDWEKIHKNLIALKEKRKKVLEETIEDDLLEAEIIHTHPLFVWWHSFVHAFINQLAIESGFMGPSLGERVYCVKNTDGYAAGVFVYASSPGADGTLGGLTSLVNIDTIPSIVAKTLDKIQNCSNDPICSSMTIKKGKRDGAACHICLMNSETSCAYQNKFLDRNIIRSHVN